MCDTQFGCDRQESRFLFIKVNEIEHSLLVLAVIPILALLFLTGCGGSEPEARIPEEIREVIFENSAFSTPITLMLPCQDDPIDVEAFKQRLKGTHRGVPPVFIGRVTWLSGQRKGILDVLIEHGFADVEELTVNWRGFGGGTPTYEFLSYSDKIKPYIYKIKPRMLGDKVDFSEASFAECSKAGGTFELRLASRVIKSIDYKNRYEQAGVDRYAVRFSYTLKKDFPHFDELAEAGATIGLHFPLRELDIDKIYKGEADAYFDPAFREWKLSSLPPLSLEDKAL